MIVEHEFTECPGHPLPCFSTVRGPNILLRRHDGFIGPVFCPVAQATACLPYKRWLADRQVSVDLLISMAPAGSSKAIAAELVERLLPGLSLSEAPPPDPFFARVRRFWSPSPNGGSVFDASDRHPSRILLHILFGVCLLASVALTAIAGFWFWGLVGEWARAIVR